MAFLFKKPKKKLPLSLIIPGTILVFALIVAIFPAIWMILVSLVPLAFTLKFPPDLSINNISFSNYLSVFTSPYYSGTAQAIRNSAIVATSSTLIVLLVGTLAAYGFSKFDFPGKRIFYIGIMIGRMFPLVSLLIPIYLVLNQLRLVDTRTGLVLVHTIISLPLMVWFMRGYIQSIPSELIDAARVDGCNELQIFYRIIMPTAMPGLVGMSTLIFVFSWGEFFFALALTYSPNVATLPVRLLVILHGVTQFDWGVVMAIGVLGSIFPIIIGVLFQKYIIAGITAGAIK